MLERIDYHSSFNIPETLMVVCYYCYYSNTSKLPCFAFYKNQTNVFVNENALCTGGPVFPIPVPRSLPWLGPVTQCFNKTIYTAHIYGTSSCNVTKLSPSSFESICLDPLKRKHRYKCSKSPTFIPSSLHWNFLPGVPDFKAYKQMVLYLVLLSLVCFSTLLCNLLILFLLIKSEKLRHAKTTLYAGHMMTIDLIISIFLIPFYFLLIFNNNYYIFKGERIISETKHLQMEKWYDQMHFFFLTISFVNIAAMGLERCIAVILPFWHMRRVTFSFTKRTLPLIWMYTIILTLIKNFLMSNVYFHFTMGFALPAATMFISYALMIARIHGMKGMNSALDARFHSQKQKQERAVTINLLILAIVFAISWLPYFILYFISASKKVIILLEDIEVRTGMRWAILATYFHCFLDGLLYILPRPNFRKEIKSMRNTHQAAINNRTLTFTSTSI